MMTALYTPHMGVCGEFIKQSQWAVFRLRVGFRRSPKHALIDDHNRFAVPSWCAVHFRMERLPESVDP